MWLKTSVNSIELKTLSIKQPARNEEGEQGGDGDAEPAV
jgi:hypothetical protein